MSKHPWVPSFSWHITVLACALGLCWVALGMSWYISTRLPAPYQPYRPTVHTATQPAHG